MELFAELDPPPLQMGYLEWPCETRKVFSGKYKKNKKMKKLKGSLKPHEE